MAIYGAVSAKIVQEDLPSNKPDVYGHSKLEGENLLSELCRQHADVGGLTIRLPGVVGAGARNNFLADSLAKILSGEQIWASNPDAFFNNVIHVDDLASSLWIVWTGWLRVTQLQTSLRESR
jgi:nucleoside-diphosphate-sugar epimerase